MRKITFTICCLLVFIPVSLSAFAQDAPKSSNAAQASESPAHYYRLVFAIQELGADSRPVNSRSFTTTVSTGKNDSARIRSGEKVPIATESAPAEGHTSIQFQYIDLGVNIDISSVSEIDRQLALKLIAEVSSVAQAADANLHQPVIRQNVWNSEVLIPVGKPTVVFTSDSLDSKGGMQLVVTATALQ